TIHLKYGPRREKTITGIRRVSRPGRRVYAGRDEIPRVLGGLGIAILSTSHGVVTDRQAKKLRLGGEALAYVRERVELGSRWLGRQPIAIPAGVQVSVEASHVSVAGPLGALEQDFHPDMRIVLDDGTLRVERPDDERLHRSLHGLTRTLLANMVDGVTKGFEK